MFFWIRHEWGRWEEKHLAMAKTTWNKNGAVVATIPYIRVLQRRTCKNCFKIEEEILID